MSWTWIRLILISLIFKKYLTSRFREKNYSYIIGLSISITIIIIIITLGSPGLFRNAICTWGW